MGLRLTEHTHGLDAVRIAVPSQGHNLHQEGYAKRMFDFTIALLAVIALAPLMIVIAIAIRLQDGKSALFHQVRFGRYGETFKCYKLRSMVPDAKERLEHLLATDPDARREWDATQKLTNDPRITPLGRFIRKTSIDELPQLFNVLRGDMSLVGPRPIVENEVVKYAENFEYYSRVRPGITGLWQVRGRSNTSYPARVAMDVEYAQDRTFWGDFKILVMTVPAVLMSRGAM